MNRIALLLLALLLSACSSQPVRQSQELTWQQRLAHYTPLTDWHLKGRLGLRSDDKSGTATLIWEETPDKRRLRLLGPVGHGLIVLEETADGATIKDSKQGSWYGASAETLVERVTGWKIPITSLRWWVLGIVEPDSEAEFQLDEQQRLVSVSQDGWLVRLADYRRADGYELPGSIVFQTGAEHDGPALRGKYVLKEWHRGAK